MRALVSIAATAALLAGPASAQQWQAQTNADREQVASLVIWESGHALVARCEAGDFQVFLRMPQTVTRQVSHRVVFEGQSRSMWLGLPWGADGGQVLFTSEPRRAARWLAEGGQLLIEASGAEPLSLPLPEDGAPLRRAMSECSVPETDARDLLADRVTNPTWARRPDPDYPLAAAEEGINQAEVYLSCLVHERGTLTDCVIERETPAAAGFGESALRAARRARLDMSSGITPGAFVIFTMRYQFG